MTKKDYTKLNKEELLEVIKNLESKKKYGLVWDEEKVPEKVVVDCQHQLPVLKEVKDKEIITDPNQPTHILIEGDNYHALSVLNYTHKGKIDLIYIDPPYNTGNKDFVYNDKFVEADDVYKHSKWLNFMSKRLELAKNLLKENGSIFCSIDDKEYPRLVMLLEGIFGENNIKTVCVKMSEATGVKMASVVKNGRIPKLKEYLVIAKNDGINNLHLDKLPKEKWDDEYKTIITNTTEDEVNAVKDIRDNEDRTQKDIDNCNSIISRWECESISDYFKNNNISKKDEIDFKYKNAWRIFRTVATTANVKVIADKNRDQINGNFFTVLTPQKKLYFILKSYNSDQDQPRIKMLIADDYLTQHPGDFWSDIKTTGLDNEGGVAFKNGKKPLKLLEKVIKTYRDNQITVLDFFVGSGTTAEAVLKLNKEDGGNRQFIACTYNEENGTQIKIAEEFCLPRIRMAADRYGGNLKYFKTAFVKNRPNKDQLKIEITKQCTEMLCLKEGIFNLKTVTKDYKIFEQNDRFMAVFYDFANASLDDLKKQMNALKGEKVLYCFTLLEKLETMNFKGWKDIRLEPIPQKILDLYLEIFKN